MKPKKRQKLCYNCEGEVDLDVIVCPFCAADLRAERGDVQRAPFAASVKPMNGEPYPPPSHLEAAVRLGTEEAALPAESAPTSSPTDLKKTVLATSLFTVGVQLLLLGLLLLVLQTERTVILKWDASLWFLYIFASVPPLVFGYRAITRL
jgi:hypothetical protein